jgi:hypothetical protein
MFRTPSQRCEECGDDCEREVVLVAVTVGTALEEAGLVVESLHQAGADLVLGAVVGRDAVSVAGDHRRELLVGLEPLPLALEEGAGPALGLAAPELAEGLLEQASGGQSLLGSEQYFLLPSSWPGWKSFEATLPEERKSWCGLAGKAG